MQIEAPALVGDVARRGLSLVREKIHLWRGLLHAFTEYSLVDSDENELALAKRLYERYGYVPVYVQLVVPDPMPIKRVQSPRLV